MNIPNNEDYYELPQDEPVFKNPKNILTQEKADMITNEFIKPANDVPEEELKTPEPVLHEQVANSVLLFIKDEDPLNEKIKKYDFSYKYPRFTYILIFLIFFILLCVLVFGIISLFY